MRAMISFSRLHSKSASVERDSSVISTPPTSSCSFQLQPSRPLSPLTSCSLVPLVCSDKSAKAISFNRNSSCSLSSFSFTYIFSISFS
uniref:Uncharacterized protein n=1 Tax=Parascaris univalens TaxID=6257 RepID=A0A915ATJ6_PARUN